MPRDYTFFVYIITNPAKSVLYIGFTNNLTQRLQQHEANAGTNKSFAGRYYCKKLIYYEVFQYVNEAIAREKELKKWSRAKKVKLIEEHNPQWHTLNGEFFISE